MDLKDANGFHIVPYSAVARSPKLKRKPVLKVPKAVIKAQIEGRVLLTVTVSSEGRVTKTKLLRGLHPEADAYCIDNAKQTTWKPGVKDGQPVSVSEVPYSCLFQMALE